MDHHHHHCHHLGHHDIGQGGEADDEQVPRIFSLTADRWRIFFIDGHHRFFVIIVFLSSLWTFSLLDQHHHWYYHVHPHDSLLVDWRRIRYLIFIDGQNINAVK